LKKATELMTNCQEPTRSSLKIKINLLIKSVNYRARYSSYRTKTNHTLLDMKP